MKRETERQSGFTLLELILSLAVVVVLVAVCLIGIRLALASRDAGTQKADAYQRLRVLHEQVNRNIRSAHLVMIRKPSDSLIEDDENKKARETKILAFEGKPHSLKFVTFSQPLTGMGPAPWMHQIRIHHKKDDLTGESQILLEEREFSPEKFFKDEKDDAVHVVTLAQDVAFLRFRYFQPAPQSEETEDSKDNTEAVPSGEWVEQILPESFDVQKPTQADAENTEVTNLSLPQVVEVSAGLWVQPKDGASEEKSWVALPPALIPLQTAVAFEEAKQEEVQENDAAVTK